MEHTITTTASAPPVAPDSLAKIAEAIGPWGFVACVALVVVWKLGTKYLEVQAERREIENEAIKELKDAFDVLKRDHEQDRDLLAQQLRHLELRVNQAEAGTKGR